MSPFDPEWIDKTEARCCVYGLLTLCFCEPTAKLIHDLVNSNLIAAFRECFEVLKVAGIEDTFEAMEAFHQVHQEHDAESIWRLCNAEYMRLFVGPGHLPCPPYESVYRTDVPAERRGLLMGKAAIAVQKKYKKARLGITPDHTDLPDHISTELEFMYFLCKKELEAWEKGDYEKGKEWLMIQQEFLTEHLDVWVSAFSRAVEKASDNPFYLGIASLCRTHISLDIERVKKVIETLEETYALRKPKRI
ncbi:MAG: molecular chaperone TorD family protein [Pseudomonadota bacterium]